MAINFWAIKEALKRKSLLIGFCFIVFFIVFFVFGFSFRFFSHGCGWLCTCGYFGVDDIEAVTELSDTNDGDGAWWLVVVGVIVLLGFEARDDEATFALMGEHKVFWKFVGYAIVCFCIAKEAGEEEGEDAFFEFRVWLHEVDFDAIGLFRCFVYGNFVSFHLP